jgi:hypothetical protein
MFAIRLASPSLIIVHSDLCNEMRHFLRSGLDDGLVIEGPKKLVARVIHIGREEQELRHGPDIERLAEFIL